MGQKVRLRGEHLTHTTLWSTAQRFLSTGLAEKKGGFYPLLAATVFAYFAFEAYLNTALRAVAPDIWKDERRFFACGNYRGTLGKLHYLAELAGLSVETSRRPFQTVNQLSEARDFLGHAKVEEFNVVVPVENLDEPRPYPSVLDKYSSPKFAKRAIEDVEKLADTLHRALLKRFGQLFFGSAAGAFSGVRGGWHTSLIPDKVREMPNQRHAAIRR
jgi:hypothetical protein